MFLANALQEREAAFRRGGAAKRGSEASRQQTAGAAAAPPAAPVQAECGGKRMGRGQESEDEDEWGKPKQRRTARVLLLEKVLDYIMLPRSWIGASAAA
eukprot:8427445-Pyramimonas_sp.AAC.1